MVLAGAWAATPTWGDGAWKAVLAAMGAAGLLGAFWTAVAIPADTPPLRLVWPPLLAMALGAMLPLLAWLVILAWCGVALLQGFEMVANATWPRLLGAVALPWWLGWCAAGGGWQVSMVIVPLAGAWLVRDCWHSDILALLGGWGGLAGMAIGAGDGVRLAQMAMVLVGILFFRMHRAREGTAWYRQHVQVWVVVLLWLAG